MEVETRRIFADSVWLSAKSGGILSSRHGGINPAVSESFSGTLSEPLTTVAAPPFESEETPPTDHKSHTFGSLGVSYPMGFGTDWL